MDEPAKSLKPISASQPAPQVQDPWIGYRKPDRTTTKIMNGQTLMRSARVPETIDAAVATKTIWKNQSDIWE